MIYYTDSILYERKHNHMEDLEKTRKHIIANRFRSAGVQYLTDNNMTQTALARRAGMSRAVIANIIAGRIPTFETAVVLSRIMNLSLDEITAGNIADVPDPKQFKKMFKTDAVKEIEKLLSKSNWYGNEFKELSEKQKQTILRLIRAYLNLTKSGNIRKK